MSDEKETKSPEINDIDTVFVKTDNVGDGTRKSPFNTLPENIEILRESINENFKTNADIKNPNLHELIDSQIKIARAKSESQYNLNDIEIVVKNTYIQCQKAYDEKLRWISVKDKLPEIIPSNGQASEMVNLKGKYYGTEIYFDGYYSGGNIFHVPIPSGNFGQFIVKTFRFPHTITHWRYKV